MPASLLRATYNAVLKAKGVPYLSYDDPALQMLYQSVEGLSPDQALGVARQAADYYRAHGYAMSDPELDTLIGQARGPTTGQETQPIVGAGAGIRQDYGGLLQQRGVSYLGPNDPQLVAAIQARIPGLTPEQATQIAQRGRDFAATTGVMAPDAAIDRAAGQAKGFTIPLPHQFDPAKWDQMMADPTAAGLFEGTVRAAGWDWDTYKRQHYAARPTGVAAPATRGAWSQPAAGVWG